MIKNFKLALAALVACTFTSANAFINPLPDLNNLTANQLSSCTKKGDSNILICAAYMVGLRDGIRLGSEYNWNLPPKIGISPQTMLTFLRRDIHQNPFLGDARAPVAIMLSLEKANVLKIRPEFNTKK